MTGLFLVSFLAIAIIFCGMSYLNEENEGGWLIASIIFFVIGLLLLIAVPISRIDSKTNVKYIETVQTTLDNNRGINVLGVNVLERTNAECIESTNACNLKISTWRTKGKKWYNNKWYYHPDTQKVEYIK
jgi:hypothetical protein